MTEDVISEVGHIRMYPLLGLAYILTTLVIQLSFLQLHAYCIIFHFMYFITDINYTFPIFEQSYRYFVTFISSYKHFG